MREILFRGKRIDNGEWVTASSIIFGEDGTVLIFSKAADIGDGNWDCQFERVDPLTVGQFTGLLDKNGKKIFEGDICEDEIGGIGIINYCDGAFGIVYDVPIDNEWTASLLCVIDGAIEVIGTIYDKEVPQ